MAELDMACKNSLLLFNEQTIPIITVLLSQQRRKCSWSTLPQHLLDCIFKFVDDNDLVNFLTINRYWSKAALRAYYNCQRRARGLDYIVRDAGALDKLIELAIGGDDKQRRIHHRIGQNWLDMNFTKYQLKTRGGCRYAWPKGSLTVADDIVVSVVREYEPDSGWVGRKWYSEDTADSDSDSDSDDSDDEDVRGPERLWLYAWPLGHRRSTADHDGLDGIRLGAEVRDERGKVSVDGNEKIIAYTAVPNHGYRRRPELFVVSHYNKCCSSSDFAANTWSVGRLCDLTGPIESRDEIPKTAAVDEMSTRHGLVVVLLSWTPRRSPTQGQVLYHTF